MLFESGTCSCIKQLKLYGIYVRVIFVKYHTNVCLFYKIVVIISAVTQVTFNTASVAKTMYLTK